MELVVNNEPEVALKVLQYAESILPSITKSIAYVKLISNILLRLGDFVQLRWIYSSLLGPVIEDEVKAESVTLPSINPEDAAELWDDFFRIEAILGLASLSRMTELRKKKNSARVLMQMDAREIDGHTGDITEGVISVLERFQHCNIDSLVSIDGGIMNRCVGLIDDRETRPIRRADMDLRRSRKEDFFALDSLTHVSPAVKEFVFNLPSTNNSGVDVSNFLDQLRRLVLPSRPDDDDENNQTASSKRNRVDDDEEDGELAISDMEDIFKKRQRMRYDGTFK